MNTKRSKNANNIRNFGLAACAILALGVMTAGEASAQCRLVGNNAGYGYNNSNSAGYGAYTNSRNYGSNYNTPVNGRYSYGATSGYRGYSSQRPQLSLGLGYNRNASSGYTGYGNFGTSPYNTGAYANRSGYGSRIYSNSQQPVAYRHGDHIDVRDGNRLHHLTGQGY